ncbi:MAG: galactokinase [Pseudomonadota bacterium]
MTHCDELRARVLAGFNRAFGQDPEILVAAPGRVNLIGEHTDYNDGFVLPCAIDYQTMIAIGSRPDGGFQVVACDHDDETDRFDPEAIFAAQTLEWKNHVRGVAASFRERKLDIGGANIAIAGNVPQGAGLSSSASLGVALGKALAEQNQLKQLSPTDFALIAQQAENDFVGCACGIMDQLASARSEAGTAMLLDCRSLESQAIRMTPDLGLLVIHSGIRRGLVDSAYNERRAQCEEAAEHCKVSALRDLTLDQLDACSAGLDPVSYRRARHVVSENARVLAAASALETSDIAELSRLMEQSHMSMRDDFEITLPAIDRLVEQVSGLLGNRGGVRMTGGGFGGCIVVLAAQAMLEEVRNLVAATYRAPDGTAPQFYPCLPSAGVARLEF